jgi:hypothetical protein
MPKGGPALLLSLDGEWYPCDVVDTSYFGTEVGLPLWLEKAVGGIRGGMSGSPILSPDGKAIGLISVGGGRSGGGPPEERMHIEGGPNPRLVHHLPGWLLRQ